MAASIPPMEPLPDPRQRILRELDSGRVAIGSERYWQLIEALGTPDESVVYDGASDRHSTLQNGVETS